MTKHCFGQQEGRIKSLICPWRCKKYKDSGLVVISNICGSLEDPQDVAAKQKLLEEAGIIVTPSNYQSTCLASAMMNALDRREQV